MKERTFAPEVAPCLSQRTRHQNSARPRGHDDFAAAVQLRAPQHWRWSSKPVALQSRGNRDHVLGRTAADPSPEPFQTAPGTNYLYEEILVAKLYQRGIGVPRTPHPLPRAAGRGLKREPDY
jgi:hypothetical protein